MEKERDYKVFKRKNGFTLIELLVVIAILALLVSILIPAITEAKKLARKAVCLANLKNLHTACLMYQNEYNGANPSAMQGYKAAQERIHNLDLTDSDRAPYWWPAIMAKPNVKLYGLSEDMNGKTYKNLGCPDFFNFKSYHVNSKTGSLKLPLWPQWLKNCYGMTSCTAEPGDHEYTYAVYQVDRIHAPGALMMLEDLHGGIGPNGTSPYAQRGLGLGKHWYTGDGGYVYRGLMFAWSTGDKNRKLNDGPHFKDDNIVFFDGHGISASPQEIYRQEYWLLAK